MKAAFLPVHWADLQGQVGVFIIAGRPLSGLAAASAIGAEPGPAKGATATAGAMAITAATAATATIPMDTAARAASAQRRLAQRPSARRLPDPVCWIDQYGAQVCN